MHGSTPRIRTALGALLVAAALLVPGLLLTSDRGIHLDAAGASSPAPRPTALGPSDVSSVRPAVSPQILTPPTWSNVTRTSAGASPPPLYDSSVAYDPADRSTVLFGGCLANQCPSNQTWVFANGTWTNITRPGDAPPAREGAAIDYDANMGGLLLFGGLAAGNRPLNDTWLFQAGRWTNLSYVGGGPSPRYGAMMAFDPAPEENGSVLYGGCVLAGLGVTCTNDTWVWQGWSGWVLYLPSTTPPAVGFAAMAYDPVDSYVVLFGGCSGTFCAGVSNQTWVFYSGQWWMLDPTTHPSARSGVASVYDPMIDAMLLFGGLNATFVLLGETWTFVGGNWQMLTPSLAPVGRSSFGLALDPTGRVPLLVGGVEANLTGNDSWAFEVPPKVTLSATAAAHEAGTSVPLTAMVTDGSGSFGLAVTFGDGAGSWIAGPGPTFEVNASYAVAGNYIPGVNLTDSAGLTATALGPAVSVGRGPSLTATATPDQVDAGIGVHFAANASSSGAPPFTFAWWFGDGMTGSGATAVHSYATPGDYGAYANLTDGVGGAASYSLSVTVVALPNVTITVGTGAPNTSAPVPVRAALAGGTGPFTFAWSFGDGSTSVLPSPGHRFSSAGTYTVQVWANDSVGGAAHATTSITVVAGNSPSGPSNGASATSTPLWFWAGIGVLAAVAVVGSLLLARRNRAP